MEDLDMLLEDLGRGKNTSANPRKPRPLSSRVDLNELEDLMEDLAAPTARQSTASTSSSAPPQPTPQPAPTYNTQPVVSPQPVQSYQAQPTQAQPESVYAVESRTSVVVDDLDSLMASLNATPARSSRRVSTRTPTQTTTTDVSPQPAPKQPVRSASNDSSSVYPVQSSYNQPQQQTYNAPPQQTYNAPPQQTYNAPPQQAYNSQPTQSSYNPQPAYQQSNQRPVSGAPGGELDSLLKDLNQQLSGMVNDSPYSKGTCWTCKQAILGEVVTAVGKTFHPEHFVCGNCRNPLGSGVFYEQGGVQHCERCYQELFCPRCGHCDKPVMDRCITAMGKKWHVEHFICTQCLRPFENGNFFEKDGRPYCEYDFFNLFAPKCGGCGEPIRADSINALGVQWHPEHFACAYCRKSLAGGVFFEHQGKPYCETHYHMQLGSLCSGCGKPIAGRVVSALDKKWHPEHFVCAFCMNPLAGGSFLEKNHKAYCRDCHNKLFGPS